MSVPGAAVLRAVVLAGGSGTRLRELAERFTGRPTPKQFVRFGGPSLLQETVRRILPAAPAGVVVVDRAWAHVARVQLRPFPSFEVIAQPCDRGTGPGLLLPLTHLLRREPEALVLVTPADHAIRDDAAFLAGLATARSAVVEEVAPVVLLGVRATSPRTDYGWIEPGAALPHGLRRVHAFVEKPPPDEAVRLLARGALWNTMVLLGRGSVLWDVFAAVCPETARFLTEACGLPPDERAAWLGRCYNLLRPCDFSRQVVGEAHDLAVLPWPDRIGWADLGTPERLLDWLRDEQQL